MKVSYSKEFLNTKIIGNEIYVMPDDILVAKVWLKSCKYLDFHCIPKSDNGIYSIAKIFKGRKLPEVKERPNREIFNSRNTFICQNCNRRILRVFDSELLAFSFRIVCECGCIYDLKRRDTFKEKESDGIKDGRSFYDMYLQINSGML